MVKLQKEEYTVGWVCALPVPEWQASRLLFDLVHEDATLGPNVGYQYAFGEINGHNVVMGCLPEGQPGVGAAASVATEMRLVFPSLRFALLVGVGGGVPRVSCDGEIHAKNHDIRLGDVVVSCINKDGRHGGVVHYDYGKSVQNGGFQPTGMLNKPPSILSSALGKVRSAPPSNSRFHEYLSSFKKFDDDAPEFSSPPKLDQLFKANYEHPAKEPTCSKCSVDRMVQRHPRTGHPVRVHYGTIASGNQVMKDAQKRDMINSTYDDDILCFEMEAAGLLDQLQCIVIRGICDYCDSHKNKKWQPFASATAAAWAKELLRNIAPAEVAKLEAVTTSSKHPLPKTAIMLPYRRDKHFVGREDTFRELDHILAEGDVVGVVGLGGVGKSQVVIEYAYRVHQSQPNTSIFWVYASSRERFRNDYQSIATKLELPGFDDLKADHLSIVFNWLQSPSSGKWLMILDNADSKDLTAGWQAKVVGDNDFNIPKYLPKKTGCAIIVTSRDRRAAFDLVGPNIIKLEPMTESEAVQLFRSKTRSREWDQVQAHRLSVQLDCIPLAITQAAAYIIADTRMTIGAYLERFQQEEEQLLSSSQNDLRRDVNIPNCVIKTWEISFHEIQKIDPAAVELLFKMCFLSKDDIPVPLLVRTNPSRRKFDETLDTLMRFSFVDDHLTERQLLKMHRLVQSATKTWIQTRSENELGRWCFESLKLVSIHWPEDDNKEWDKCRLLEPHAESVLGSAETHWPKASQACKSSQTAEDDIDATLSIYRYDLPYTTQHALMIRAGLLLRRAKYAHRQGRLHEAVKFAEQAKQGSEAALTRLHPDTLSIGSFLAVSYLHAGDLQRAKRLGVEIAELQGAMYGDEDPDTLVTLCSLAMAYRGLGRLEKAETILSSVISIYEWGLVEDEDSLMMAMNDLAIVYGDQGQWEMKESLERTILSRLPMRSESNQLDKLSLQHNLALSMEHLGRFEEAESLFEEVMKGKRNTFGDDHPSTLISMGHLANVLWCQDRLLEAYQLQQQILDRHQHSALPETHPTVLRCSSDVALYHHKQGRLVEAHDIQLNAFTLHQKALKETSGEISTLRELQERTLLCQERLAAVLWSMDRHQDAKATLQTCVDECCRCLGHNHHSTVASRNLLSSWGSEHYSRPDIWAAILGVRAVLLDHINATADQSESLFEPEIWNAIVKVRELLLTELAPGAVEEGFPSVDNSHILENNVDADGPETLETPLAFDHVDEDLDQEQFHNSPSG